jgi:hypothetical protein
MSQREAHLKQQIHLLSGQFNDFVIFSPKSLGKILAILTLNSAIYAFCLLPTSMKKP